FTIPSLGQISHRSPLELSTVPDDQIADFTPNEARFPYDPVNDPTGPSFELAGPRQMNHFRGPDVVAGIVTCGGLCPGMNNVIRGLVLGLWRGYGVKKIYGYRYGFQGLGPKAIAPPLKLTPEHVSEIHLQGGTVLGSSRGPQPAKTMADTLKRMGINVLFCIGGDGTMRGALALYQEIKKRKLHCAVIGIPKTVDNDLPFNEHTFGFDTAVSIANDAIRAAHVEASGAPNGIGLVRLMGRHSGFIAAAATLASRQVNLVLVPELPFDLQGNRGILSYLRKKLKERGHAVVVVAEGAGQRHLNQEVQRDRSGNIRMGNIGIFLKETFLQKLNSEKINLKYIDPSYIIRAAPANTADSILCGQLAEDAVHAAIAGKTGMVVGLWHNRLIHIPLVAAATGRKQISLDSTFWRNVVETTGQPALLSTKS
ncbi:MAG: ATP-dependent 6-phosphofructokinase, partial [Pseudomonadota bacterium]